MTEQLKRRLKELQAEFECGKKVFADMETRQSALRDSLVRISGAIQVLEELLKSEQTTQPIENFEFPEAQPVAASA